jgi:hypothetical protein
MFINDHQIKDFIQKCGCQKKYIGIAILVIWRLLPDEKKTMDELKQIIYRLSDRVVTNF